MPHGFEDIEDADEDDIFHDPAQEDTGTGATKEINGELKDKANGEDDDDDDREEEKEGEEEEGEEEEGEEEEGVGGEKVEGEKEAPETSKAADNASEDDAEGAAKGEDKGEDDESDDSGEEALFSVETIRNHKFVRGVVFYLIKWQGYGEKDNTWEPEEHLLPHARQLLADYHEKIGGIPVPPVKKTRSRQRLREAPSSDDPPPAKRLRRGRREDASIVDKFSDAWLPDEEDWESLVDYIETVQRDNNGQLMAFIAFTNGKMCKINMDMVYQHCALPMLKFYEEHLKFT